MLGASIALYADGGWSWLAYLLLILAPDLSMLGYLAGPRTGALAYDLAHFAALPHGARRGRRGRRLRPRRCSWR